MTTPRTLAPIALRMSPAVRALGRACGSAVARQRAGDLHDALRGGGAKIQGGSNRPIGFRLGGLQPRPGLVQQDPVDAHVGDLANHREAEGMADILGSAEASIPP